MKYIEKSIEDVKNSDYCILEHEEDPKGQKRHKMFRLKVPAYLTSWQTIVQYEASLYYAFTTKGLTFIDDQIYHNSEKEELLSINNPSNEIHGNIWRLHERD
jgi:hypothetical protein